MILHGYTRSLKIKENIKPIAIYTEHPCFTGNGFEHVACKMESKLESIWKEECGSNDQNCHLTLSQTTKSWPRPNFKTFSDNNFSVAIIMISDRTGNIVGKGENTGYQHFLLFPLCLQNTTVCQSAGGDIKSHLVTSLV